MNIKVEYIKKWNKKVYYNNINKTYHYFPNHDII